MKRLLGLALLAVGFLGCGDGQVKQVAVLDFDAFLKEAPKEWGKEDPGEGMRAAQFRLPRAEGDEADGVVTIFKGLGGSAEANIERWKGQFQPPEGKKIDDIATVRQITVRGVPALYLDVQGTFDSSPPAMRGHGEKKENQRMLAVHIDDPKAVYHITLKGPAKTVAKYKAGFEAWLTGSP